MEIGRKLKGLRIEKGFEPHDMASKLNISETTWRRYESNKPKPDINMLEKIALAFDKTITDLLPENILFNNTDQKVGIALACYHSTINQQSEKLIDALENQILLLKEKLAEQKGIIAELRSVIAGFKTQNKAL